MVYGDKLWRNVTPVYLEITALAFSFAYACQFMRKLTVFLFIQMKARGLFIFFPQKINMSSIFFHLEFSPHKVKIWRNQVQTVCNWAINIQFLLWVAL